MTIDIGHNPSPAQVGQAAETPVLTGQSVKADKPAELPALESPLTIQTGDFRAPGEIDAGAVTEIADAVLRRDDNLGQLFDKAFNLAAPAMPVGLISSSDPGKTVAQNIGESADELKELFDRNKEEAYEKAQRQEAVLDTEVAKAANEAERQEALARENAIHV